MEVRRYLQHVNLDYEPPARAPPRMVQGELDLVEELDARAFTTSPMSPLAPAPQSKKG